MNVRELVMTGFKFLLWRWKKIWKHDILILFFCEVLWFIDIILWGNWNWSNIWHVPWFEGLLSYYHCCYSQELNDLFSVTRIIGVYIYHLHYIIIYFVGVYYWESPIWKGEVGFLVCFESLQNLFYVLTRRLSNLCETASLVTSYSTSGVKSISLPILGY